ncbi:MAG: F0F1 ATP synthase subunit B [Akkermansiaceae bacterium]|nr:F0F1 ATP synthase subunit B [Akkermansiaceae bacterium]
MPIDWFTVVAQILNFLVLVWILKRFLYRPVLRVIAERQARVEQSLTEAATLKEAAGAELEKLSAERRTLAEHRDAELAAAQQEAAAERQKLLDAARTDYEAARTRWRSALEHEREDFQRELSRQAHDEVIGIADKLLRDLADTDLQERILGKFLAMLARLPEAEKAALRAGAGKSKTGAVIRSAFGLNDERRGSLEKAAREILGAGAPVAFETKASLGCGIELAVDGHKIAWTLEDYLRSLDTWVTGLLAGRRRGMTT